MMTQQPGPLDSCGPDIADMLCDEIMKRKQFGLDKYGKPLRANNGRKALRDLLAEQLDGCHYTLQEILEREALADSLRLKARQVREDDDLYRRGLSDGLKWAARLVDGGEE